MFSFCLSTLWCLFLVLLLLCFILRGLCGMPVGQASGMAFGSIISCWKSCHISFDGNFKSPWFKRKKVCFYRTPVCSLCSFHQFLFFISSTTHVSFPFIKHIWVHRQKKLLKILDREYSFLKKLRMIWYFEFAAW